MNNLHFNAREKRKLVLMINIYFDHLGRSFRVEVMLP